jgi:hypothetical protein
MRALPVEWDVAVSAAAGVQALTQVELVDVVGLCVPKACEGPRPQATAQPLQSAAIIVRLTSSGSGGGSILCRSAGPCGREG